MNSFERALFGDAQIPIHEASSFFLSMKRPSFQSKVAGVRSMKTAGWQDPPDETGVMEGQFEVPLEHAVSLMGKSAMYLLRLMTAGLIYSKSVRGPFAAEVKDAICHNEWDHKHSFEYLVERMTVLAGAPHIPDSDMPPPSTDPLSVAQRMIRAEQEMIQSYQELAAVLGKNPMRDKIKCFMSQCQEHLDGYWMALPPEYGNKLMQPKPADMLARHEAAETPEMEALESPEFQLAEQAAGVEQHEPVLASVKTAAALMVKWAKEAPTDEELRESGRQSAVKTIAAEHGRESARRGERVGRTVGMLAGAAGGGALGHALGKGHPAASLGGAALGGLAGRSLGGEIGTEVDIARHKTSAVKLAAAAMLAWVKKADEGVPEAEAPMASPTDNQEIAPVNYLNAELMGQQAQQNNEANFYRQKALVAEQAAQQAQAQAQAQVQQVQQEAAQAQADAENAAQKVKAALDEAIKAKDDALKQTETAARMRIGQQDLRMKLLELAAQDPDMTAAMNLAQTTGQAAALGPPTGEVMSPDAGLNPGPGIPPAPADAGAPPPSGPAGAAPDQQTAPGAAPPEGAPDMNAPAGPPPGPDPSMASPAMGPKTSAARRMRKTAGLIGAGIGATLGGVDQAVRTRSAITGGVEPVQSRIAELEGGQDGSYGQAAALAKAKTLLANRELAIAHPTQAMVRNTGSGLLRGALLGSGIEDNSRKLYGLLTQ